MNIFEHFRNNLVESPRSALGKFGDMPLSEYVAALDASGIGRECLNNMTHQEILLKHLTEIGPITSLGAALLYDIWRASEPIRALREKCKKEGLYRIVSDEFTTSRGGYFVQYRLEDIPLEETSENP
jgi:hypothetical protein